MHYSGLFPLRAPYSLRVVTSLNQIKTFLIPSVQSPKHAEKRIGNGLIFSKRKNDSPSETEIRDRMLQVGISLAQDERPDTDQTQKNLCGATESQ